MLNKYKFVPDKSKCRTCGRFVGSKSANIIWSPYYCKNNTLVEIGLYCNRCIRK